MCFLRDDQRWMASTSPSSYHSLHPNRPHNKRLQTSLQVCLLHSRSLNFCILSKDIVATSSAHHQVSATRSYYLSARQFLHVKCYCSCSCFSRINSASWEKCLCLSGTGCRCGWDSHSFGATPCLHCRRDSLCPQTWGTV